MAREKLIDVHQFRDKLPIFYSRTALHPDRTLWVRKDAELRSLLQVGKGTLSQWQHGKDGVTDKDRMSPAGLRKVSQHLCCVLDGRIDEARALDLWQNAEAEDFARVLWRHTCRSIEEALETRSPNLKIELMLDSPSRRQMVKIKSVRDEQVREVSLDSSYSVAVQGEFGEQLVLLAITIRGIQLLAPASWHSGNFSKQTERIPGDDQWFEFDDYSGEYHFIAIALEADSCAPILPQHTSTAPLLSEEDTWRFATYLARTECRWRWGEQKINAVRGKT